MATDLSSDAAVPVVEANAPAPEPEPKRRRLYLPQFAVIYLILIVAFVGTGAGVIIATYGVSLKDTAPWSSWTPPGGGIAKTNAIAQRVGGAYRLTGGHQLLDVYSKKLTVPVASGTASAEVPIALVAIRGPKGKVDTVNTVTDTDSRLYELCGSGAACAIGEGKASIARGQLVRREALELALYTFKYVHGVNHFLAFMPPPPGSSPSAVVYLDKADVSAMLARPLTKTLGAKTPLPTTITASEGARIDQLMMPHLYKFTLQQTQLGQAVLVLAPATT
jgi:hypothetical protein